MAWSVFIWKIYGFSKTSLYFESLVLKHATAHIHTRCAFNFRTSFNRRQIKTLHYPFFAHFICNRRKPEFILIKFSIKRNSYLARNKIESQMRLRLPIAIGIAMTPRLVLVNTTTIHKIYRHFRPPLPSEGVGGEDDDKFVCKVCE